MPKSQPYFWHKKRPFVRNLPNVQGVYNVATCQPEKFISPDSWTEIKIHTRDTNRSKVSPGRHRTTEHRESVAPHFTFYVFLPVKATKHRLQEYEHSKAATWGKTKTPRYTGLHVTSPSQHKDNEVYKTKNQITRSDYTSLNIRRVEYRKWHVSMTIHIKPQKMEEQVI